MFLSSLDKVKGKFKGASESKSKAFLFVCVSFILGTGFASILIKNRDLIFLFFCSSVFLFVLLSYFFKDLKKRFLILMSLFFILGILRYILILPTNESDELRIYNGNNLYIKGIVASNPELSGGSNTRFIFNALEIEGKKVSGLAQIKTSKYPEYHYGDKLEMKCDLKSPMENYVNYLSRKNIYSVCDYPKSIKILGQEGNKIMDAIFFVKKKFSDSIFKIFPEPHASLLAGILYGEDEGLSKKISNAFRAAGVSHIVAVSGYNISIVAEFIFLICAFVFFFIPKKFAFWIAFAAIFVFSIISGAEASVIRAGLMYFVVMFSRQIGRPSQEGRVLVLAATAMVAQNPKILVFDIGFQLSFSAIFGLFYLSPILEKRVEKIPDFWGIKKLSIETFSAIIMTSPLILYYFGNFSIVAPLSNVVILFFIPSAMLFGFFAGLFGIFYLPLGKIFGFFAWTILNYIIYTVEMISKIPYVSLKLDNPPFIFVLWLYILIFYFVFWKRRKAEEKVALLNEKKEIEEFAIEER